MPNEEERRQQQEATKSGGETKTAEGEGKTRKWSKLAAVGPAAGLASILLAAASSKTDRAGAAIVAAGVLVAGAAALVGGLLGFLFGIPRSLRPRAATMERQRASGRVEPTGRADGETRPDVAAGDDTGYRGNTNLEQISDWLTKILVGVGLTQLGRIRDALSALGEALGPMFGGGIDGNQFAVVLALYFALYGFLVGFLWTRLELGGAFRSADLAAIGRRAEQTASRVVDLERMLKKWQTEQALNDKRAMQLADQFLSWKDVKTLPPKTDLEDAIAHASPIVKDSIFQRASEQRSYSWDRDKKLMERTIPVFRALIRDDPDNHRVRANLGYALKDRLEPELEEARSELSEAIRIRGEARTEGWNWYEFNRAVCLIMLEGACAKGRSSGDAWRTEILADLMVAASAEPTSALLERQDPIPRWLKLNGMEVAQLRKAA